MMKNLSTKSSLTLNSDIQGCTFAKAVLMLCVVMYHSGALWTKSGNWVSFISPAQESNFLAFIVGWLGSFHVHTFTLISGFIFYVKVSGGGYIKFVDFLKNKFKRLVIPSLVVKLIWVIPTTYFFYHYTLESVIKSYIFGTGFQQMWFLIMLFGVFIIGWLFYHYLGNKPLWVGIVFCVLLYLFGELFSLYVSNYWQIFSACRFFIYFWIGMSLSKYMSILFNSGVINLRNKHLILFLLIINVAIYVLLAWSSCIQGYWFRRLLSLFLSIEGSVTIFSALLYLAERVAWSRNKFFCLLSNTNFITYLLHQQIIFWILWLLNGRLNPSIIALLNFVISITISTVLAIPIQKSKLLRFCFGLK